MNFFIIYAICSKIEVIMFLPVSMEEVKKLGWDYIDVIIVTGDAYIDHERRTGEKYGKWSGGV